MTVIGYAFEEAWASIRRAGRSAAVSIVTIAIAFVTLGSFLLVSVNPCPPPSSRTRPLVDNSSRCLSKQSRTMAASVILLIIL